MSRKFKVKTIPLKWILKEGRRLDCGPYMSGAMEARELLQKSVADKLISLTSGYKGGIYNGPQFVRNYVDDPAYGVSFLTTSTMLQADLTNLPMISVQDAHSTKLSYLEVEDKMILITCSGRIGRMTYARKDMVGCWSNQDIMKVVANNNKITSGYLYSFLSSRFGVPLIVSGTYGAIIQHIEPQHIADLPVPRLGAVEEQAHELIQRAADLRVEAAKQINEATARYLAAAKLDNIPPYDWNQNSGRMGFTATISKTILRAINYIPLNQKLASDIKSKCPKWKQLGDITEPGTLRSGARFKRIDCEPEFGVELIGQREIANLVPNGRWIARNHLPNDTLIVVPDGTIMVNAQGGLNESDSFARVQFITGKRLGYAYSQHFLRVISIESEIPRGALFAFLRSNLAFRLLRACAVGSMQQDFHPELIHELPIPIISRVKAEMIDKMVRQAYHKYDEAVDCEDQARALVERAIEEGGG